MKLFHVALDGGKSSRYVLATGFDAAVEAAVSEYGERAGHAIATADAATVADLGTPLHWAGAAPEEAKQLAPPTPAVPVKKSIHPDYLVCLDDGLQFKSLKRHLSVLGMTPDEYRAKWGLPADYPMVAPNYSAVRSGLAKANGLGKK